MDAFLPIVRAVSLALVVIGFAAIPVVIAMHVISRRRLRQRIYGDRSHMEPEEYYLTYFADSSISRETVAKVLTILSDETWLDFSRIHPDRKFSNDLNELLHGDDFVAIDERLDEEFPIGVKEIPFVETPRDLFVAIDTMTKAATTS